MASITDSVMTPGTVQKVSVSGSSAATTNAIAGDGNGVGIVRLMSTTDCYVKFGVSPTATTNDMYIAAYQPEYFKINAGEKVAAIQVSASGTLGVTEMQ